MGLLSWLNRHGDEVLSPTLVDPAFKRAERAMEKGASAGATVVGIEQKLDDEVLPGRERAEVDERCLQLKCRAQRAVIGLVDRARAVGVRERAAGRVERVGVRILERRRECEGRGARRALILPGAGRAGRGRRRSAPARVLARRPPAGASGQDPAHAAQEVGHPEAGPYAGGSATAGAGYAHKPLKGIAQTRLPSGTVCSPAYTTMPAAN
jgi:hypothetical protein